MTRASFLIAVALAACGGKDARAPVGTDDGRHLEVLKRSTASQGPLSGHLVASVGEHVLGPFLARRGSGDVAAGLVAWVTAAEGSNRRVLVVPIGANGAPRGSETVAAWVSVDTTMMTVQPMRGPSPGFVVAWTSLTDRGKSLWSVVVGDDGKPRAKPIELTRSNDDIAWIDIVPTDHGAVCLWAEETRDSGANLVAASLDTDGQVRGAAARVATGVVAWHALELPSGVGLSTVRPEPSAKGESRTRPGALAFQRLDPDGHPSGAAVSIASKPVVSGDVDVARDGERLVFAWTDRSAEEPAVALAALDEKNHVTAPRRVVEARGGAALLGLTAGQAGVGLLFEAPVRRKGDARHVHLTHVDANLARSRSSLSLDAVGNGRPEIAATSTGYAILATTPDCERGSVACLNAEPVATVLRTDEHAAVVQREPLKFVTDPATVGWGMTCDGDVCFALAASPGSPARIRSAAVRPSANAKPAPKPEPAIRDGASTSEIIAIATGETVVDIAVTHIGDSTVVATLSAPEGHKRGALVLSTRLIDARGTVGAAQVVSTRAFPVGGIAIAPAEKPEDGGAIAWVGHDGGDPEVHVTRIDKRGKLTNDAQLTNIKGDASDVTITWAGGGWIVAWVDGRDGNGEVYATKVAPDLSRSAREERLTSAPGDASDLVALAHDGAVWLAWADPRESPKEGFSDIYVSAVRMRDAKRAVPEQRILATAAHSRTPQLAVGDGGLQIAWIEEAPLGAETPGSSGYGAFWSKLDTAGKAERPQRLPLASDGAATAVALDGLHAVVARSGSDGLTLDGIDLGITPPRAAPLLTLDGPPSLDVALVLDENALYFNDDGPQPADRRARRARIAWKKAGAPTEEHRGPATRN